jgi:hypothetical protein
MAGEASAALGAPEIAGAMVNPRGLTKKMSVSAVGGVVGPATLDGATALAHEVGCAVGASVVSEQLHKGGAGR